MSGIQRKLKVGLVGVGGWGYNIFKALQKIDTCTLTTVCDVNPSNLSKAQINGIKCTSDIDAIIDSDIDAVIIATNSPSHAKLIMRFLRTGIPVYVEKPITLNTHNTLEILDYSESNNIQCMVGHLLRYHPAVDMLRIITADDEFGDMQYIYTKRLNLGTIRREENVLWSLAPHDVSIILDLYNELPTKVLAHGYAYTGTQEDVAFATLLFESGKMANIHVSWLDPHKERKVVIVGANKMVVFDDMSTDEKIKIYDKKALTNGNNSVKIESKGMFAPYVPSKEPLVEELKHFIGCIQNGSKPLSDAMNGYQVVNVLESAQTSLVKGKWINIKW